MALNRGVLFVKTSPTSVVLFLGPLALTALTALTALAPRERLLDSLR
ncbi:MAG TPA: hypothetical protein VJ921_09370 [Vicinamibacteria bacterium]|nr:hypothetical protein [Vicinamibacteria bacterium]